MPEPALTAAAYFGGMVESYDSLIRRAVPRYDEMTDRLMDSLPRAAPSILELGCGTGNLTLRLVERFSNASITTVDAAPEMTAITAHRAGKRVTTITERFEELDFKPGAFNLVTSCMSLHHVRDIGVLYRAIARWLTPDGAVRIADQVLGATDELQRLYWDRWLEFCHLPGHCTEEEIRSLEDHAAAHDHYVPLAEHSRLLSAAGFARLDCVWRNWMYTVIAAEK